MNTPEITARQRLGLAVAALVLAGVFSILFGWISDAAFGHETWTRFVLANFRLVIGLPMAAALAFGIVMAFQQTTDGPLAMRLGPLEINGPAGPTLLWVVCFLSIVFAIRFVTP